MLALADAARLPLPDALFHCIVFSPPYWGLRAYLGDQGRGLFPNLGLRWMGTDISFEYLDQQAKPRAAKLTPSNALDELPLFSIDRDEN